MSKLQEQIQDFKELETPKKAMLAAVAATFILIIAATAYSNAHKPKPLDNDDTAPAGTPTSSATGQAGTRGNHYDVLPTNQRNMGLEDMNTRLDRLEAMDRSIANMVATGNPQQAREFLKQYGQSGRVPETPSERAAAAASASSSASGPTSASATVSLDEPLAADLAQPGSKTPPPINWNGDSADGGRGAAQQPAALAAPAPPPRPKMRNWPSETKPLKDVKAEDPSKIIPVNSAADAVMLSGVNARPPGTTTGAAGSATSALNVGAPFVTRLKGDVILPNGWRVSDLGDCFLSGSAIGILSTQRADAIADEISCIDANGEEWEAKVKAYALDVDGTLGIAGHVVNKQGSVLMQATLAGIASGIGQSFSPSSLSSYNSNATSGSQQGYQLPNPTLIAGTAVGQGVNAAGQQISKFYLDYAKEIFPAVEVVAGTRVTWVFKETLELKPRNQAKSVG